MPRNRSSALKVVAHVLTAVVVAHREPGRRACGHSPEVIPHALAHRFQRLEARAVFRGVQPHTFGGAVIDRPEDRDLAVGQGDRARRIRTPHYVGTRGDDGAVVGTGDDRRGQTRGAEQVGGTHHDQRAALRGAQALRPQAGPNLPMPFTMKRTLGDDRPDVGGQRRIGPRRLRPALRRGRGVIPSISPGLHRGARHLPYAGDAGDPVRLLGGGRSFRDSSLRPPPAQRAAGLQMPNLLDQERLVRGEIRHDALQAARVLILDGRLPMFQAGLPARRGTRHATARVSRPSPRGVD